MQLEPYIYFYGRCEEALAFYKSIFGGEYDIHRFEGSPMAENMPPEARNGVMHAAFNGPGFRFMASDGPGPKQFDPESGNIALSMSIKERADGERIFGKLAEGGNVRVPFGPAFWGGTFGVVTDKFGTEWMIAAE